MAGGHCGGREGCAHIYRCGRAHFWLLQPENFYLRTVMCSFFFGTGCTATEFLLCRSTRWRTPRLPKWRPGGNSTDVLQELGEGGTLSFTRGHSSTSPSDTDTGTDTDADTDANTRTRSASESHSGGEEGEEEEEGSRVGRRTEGSGSGSGLGEEEEDGHHRDGSSASLASSLASQNSAIARRFSRGRVCWARCFFSPRAGLLEKEDPCHDCC